MYRVDLWDAAGISANAVVSVIGAGGKTTLVLALAKQSSERGFATLVTTTTKMWPPALPLQLARDGADYDDALRVGFAHHHLLAAGSAVSEEGKLVGLDADLLCSLAAPDVILCEADGAAGRSLKIHRPGEPVVPACTSHLIVVAGLDAIGRPVREAAHPPAFSAQHFGVSEDALIAEHQIVAALLEGASYKPEGAQLILMLNKADTDERLRTGRRMARVAAMHKPDADVLLTSHGEVVEGTCPLPGEPPYTRP